MIQKNNIRVLGITCFCKIIQKKNKIAHKNIYIYKRCHLIKCVQCFVILDYTTDTQI